MSEHVYHRSPRFFDVKGVIELLARAQGRIEDFQGFDPGDLVMVELHPEALTSLEDLKGLRVNRLWVEGGLPLDDDPFPVFSQVLEKGREIGQKGQTNIKVGFEEKGSRQTEEYHALSSIRLVRNVINFGFSSREAMTKGVAYGRDLMHKVSNFPGLPLQLVDEGDGDFRLEHSEGAKLSIRMSLNPLGINPVFFSCSLPNATTDEAVDLLARFIRNFGSSRCFDYTWKVFPMPGTDEVEVSREIYETIAASPDTFKASRYVVEADIHIDQLADLEAIRALCGEEDRIVTALGYYRPSDVNWVSLEVVTRSDGYRLNVESRLDIDGAELGETLGVDLEQGKWE